MRALAIALPVLVSLAPPPLLATQCGKEGRAPCNVWERFPPGCDLYLVARGGRCVHPPCGRLGQRPCTVDVRIPSCDAGLIEWGNCVRKGDCGAAFQRPCTVADRIPPSCNPGLSEDFTRKECVPTRAGHSAFFDGLLSLTSEVGKGSRACEGFLLASSSVQKVEWFGSLPQGSTADDAGKGIDAALDCHRHMAIGFVCATPSQAKKVGAPVELYNNLADAYASRTCAPEVQAPEWRHHPAKLLGPSRGPDCTHYDSNRTADPRGGKARAGWDATPFDPPFFDPLPDPTRAGGGIGSCWACPQFTYRSTTSVDGAHACTRGDERDPQLRALCASFTTFVDRGVKPLQCLERVIGALVAGPGADELRNRLCKVGGALAFDIAVDAAIGRVDPQSNVKKLAEAIATTRTVLKGPALLVKLNEEVREVEACKGLFTQ